MEMENNTVFNYFEVLSMLCNFFFKYCNVFCLGPPSAAPRVRELRRPQRSLNGGHRNRSAAMQSSGIAARFSMAVGEGERIGVPFLRFLRKSLNSDGGDTADLLSPYDSVQLRPELVGLAPIMLMPSMDSEVVALQKQVRVCHF